MVEIRNPINVAEAVDRVMRYKQTGKKETVSFHDCDHRWLAEPIVATDHVPSFDKSPYDGFAFRSADTTEASTDQPASFEIIEHIGAGEVAAKAIGPGQATRIMTGAQIPKGADCVAMFEECHDFIENNTAFMTIDHPMEKGQNIIQEGSEVKKGTVLIKEGTPVNPGVKALLATFGYSEVKVAKKPVVGVIATGTELLDVDEPLEPGKIRNSNAYTICSQVERAGGISKYYGKLADELEPSYSLMKQALAEVDILITTGGVSVGDFDLMPVIYEKLGANVLFNKVKMRPGSVTTVAALEDKLLYGLSGNPSACYVGFELFTRPIIRHSLFSSKPFLKRIQATMADELPKANPFSRFVRSYVTYEDGKVFANLAGIDKSNIVTSLAHTTALMVLPGGTSGYEKGDTVDVLLLEQSEGQAAFS
ncbi:molybdopterin molybdotransferase MoeA [Virgibacillus sp. W0181]|uniref:molybdopterin molybdotransferase MoeA n=1 Tax=Virgibacillus sp. W0181 TaxID=3391581 RepID=UPI003F45542E